jgi:nucleoside-diphosphate-sugar epimerase
MKILIIGGSRFVGPHLIKQLLDHDHQLTVFNRGSLSTDYPKGVEYIQGDRNGGFGIKKKFDAVIDMCAYTGAQTEKALRELNFDYFLHFGTVAAYEKTEIFPLTEASPIGDWPSFGEYNKGKVECERMLGKSGINYGTLRPVYILGPKNYCDRENFIYSRIKRGQALVLPGNGLGLAQYVFVDEVAQTILKLVEGKANGAYNISGDQMITLLGLVLLMGNIVGKKPKIGYDPDAVGMNFKEENFPFDNENLIVSNSKIKEYGMKFISLDEGLHRDYKNYYASVT